MRADLAARLGQIHWNLHPLWELAPRVDHKNDGLVESNLLSLSYGKVVRKDINEIGGLRPDSYETYNIIDSGDTVLRMTDLQNDQRSIRTGLATERGIITSAYITVRPDCDKVEPRFLHSVLRSYDIKKTFYEMGAGVRQTLKYAELADLPIPLPPRDTQREIADYLDRETGEIDAMITKMEQLDEALWGRRMAAIFNEVWVKSDITTVMVPFWSVVALVSELTAPQEFQVSLEDMVSNTGRLIEGDMSSYPARGVPFQEGDILFGKLRPYLAKYWLAETEGTAGGDIHVYRPNKSIFPRYLSYLIGSQNFISYAESCSKGTKMPRVEWMSLREIKIPKPSIDKQRRIAGHLDEVTGKIDAMQAKVAELKSLLIERRAALITEVVTGRKKVA